MLKRLRSWQQMLPKPLAVLVRMLALLLAGAVAAAMLPILLGGLFIGAVLLHDAITTKEYIGPEYYQYTYTMIEDWNKSSLGTDREDLFGYGEYLYNSHMLLFPRETPSTLEEYYFYWMQSIDVDYYGVYFTCQMSEEDYAGFASGMANFTMATPNGTIRPVYDTDSFAHPTYILQWLNEGDKWEVLEYVMLDEEKHTAVFVYTMGALEKIEEHSAYAVTPKTMAVLSDEQHQTGFSFDRPSIQQYFSGFSVYDGLDTAAYDLSFLEFLK